MTTLALRVNGSARQVQADDPDIPLLYLLRNDLGLTGTKFGCGLAQCGTVQVDGRAVRSCMAPAKAVAGQEIVTIEGLGSPDRPDPLQAAFIAEQAAQCGYCPAGMIVTARALLATTPPAERAAGARRARREPVPLRHARARDPRGDARCRERRRCHATSRHLGRTLRWPRRASRAAPSWQQGAC